jgi:hypothetical protein
MSPVVFDMRLLENPRFLLTAYLADNAIETNRSFDSVQYDFLGSEEISIEPGALFLTRLAIIAGSAKGGVVSIRRDPDDQPSMVISSLVAKVVPKGKGNNKASPIPLYRQAFLSAIGGKTEQEVATANGDSDNFVCNIMMPVDCSESALLQAGTRFVCRLPQQLS